MPEFLADATVEFPLRRGEIVGTVLVAYLWEGQVVGALVAWGPDSCESGDAGHEGAHVVEGLVETAPGTQSRTASAPRWMVRSRTPSTARRDAVRADHVAQYPHGCGDAHCWRGCWT
ncbi:hypothetical protein [Actinosynnema sp. NPDC023587]|uniref:hypothetical protein n=1 Tax=Actinosynnema sp. NPDC023587 TaxID=3154695 RepID=UPI0033C6D58D